MHKPETFSAPLRALGERFLAEAYEEVDSVAEALFELWSEAIIDLVGPTKWLARSQLQITRYLIRQLLQELCYSGSKGACERLRDLDSDWRGLIGSRRLTAKDIRTMGDKKLDPFDVRRLGDETYPIVNGLSVHDEIDQLLRSYVFHESYTPGAYEISLGLYRMINSAEPRNAQLLAKVRTWLGDHFEGGEVVSEAFDQWMFMFKLRTRGNYSFSPAFCSCTQQLAIQCASRHTKKCGKLNGLRAKSEIG